MQARRGAVRFGLTRHFNVHTGDGWIVICMCAPIEFPPTWLCVFVFLLLQPVPRYLYHGYLVSVDLMLVERAHCKLVASRSPNCSVVYCVSKCASVYFLYQVLYLCVCVRISAVTT